MSRAKARETLNMESYKEAMAGIYTTSVNEDTLDEAPMAYKSLEDILDVIGETVEVMDVMKPIYNFKASNEDAPWMKKKEEADGNRRLSENSVKLRKMNMFASCLQWNPAAAHGDFLLLTATMMYGSFIFVRKRTICV